MIQPVKENRRMTGMRLPPDLMDALGGWCKAQRPPVTKTAVIEMVVRDFLEEKKALPKRSGSKRERV